MSTQVEVGDQYYLTRAQYNALKDASQLIKGAQYYITDEYYVEQDENGNVVVGGTLTVNEDATYLKDIKIEDATLQATLVAVLGNDIIA